MSEQQVQISAADIPGSSLSSNAAPSSSSKAIELAQAQNFRDVVASDSARPYVTQSGQPLRMGVIYRSSASALQVLEDGVWQELGVTMVYDLRTPSEIKSQPDNMPERVLYRNINVLGMDNVVFGILTSPSATVSFMEDLQRRMVNDAQMRQGFGIVFEHLADSESPQLFHCTGGKDRTGWVSALLLSYVGVSEDDVMQDYLLSNQRLHGFIEGTYEAVAKRYGKDAADAIRPALTVQESFLQAGLDRSGRTLVL